MAQPTFPHSRVNHVPGDPLARAGRRRSPRRMLAIGALLALVVVAAVSLYLRPRAPAGTKVDSSGQRGSGPR